MDPTSAKKLGRLLGFDAIVSGSVSDLAKSLRNNARLISTEAGEIFAVASTEIFKDESVLKLLAVGAQASSGDISSSSTVKPTKPAVLTKDYTGLTLVLKQCKLSATAVSCDLDITSNDTDRRVSLYTYPMSNPSRLFDESGNEFMVARVRLGNRVGEHVEATLVAGVPVKAALRFEGISSTATKISLLRIRGTILFSTEIRDLTVEFRDVPLLR